jgi:transcriptional regulator with XRE-family HTH domain
MKKISAYKLADFYNITNPTIYRWEKDSKKIKLLKAAKLKYIIDKEFNIQELKLQLRQLEAFILTECSYQFDDVKIEAIYSIFEKTIKFLENIEPFVEIKNANYLENLKIFKDIKLNNNIQIDLNEKKEKK